MILRRTLPDVSCVTLIYVFQHLFGIDTYKYKYNVHYNNAEVRLQARLTQK